MSNTKTLSPSILAMYFGCDIQCPDKEIRQLVGVCDYADDSKFHRVQTRKNGQLNVNWFDLIDVKPILRPLSSMTEDEARQILELYGFTARSLNIVHVPPFMIGFEYDYYEGDSVHKGYDELNFISPDVFAYLLSKHFDLFNLIPDGLAVEKK